MALLRQGDLQLSIEHFRRAIQIDAECYAAHVNLGMALSEQGKLDEAVAQFHVALKIDPERAESHVNLATILYRQSKYEEAIQHCRELVRRQPDSVERLNQLASILSTCPSASVRNGSEAVELAQKAVAQSGGQEPLYLDTLAAAYAESGDFAKAVETAEQATTQAYRQNKFTLANTLRSRISLYKARSPLRNQPSPGRPAAAPK